MIGDASIEMPDNLISSGNLEQVFPSICVAGSQHSDQGKSRAFSA